MKQQDLSTSPPLSGVGAPRTVNPWVSVGVTMFVGLFVAYLDRSALSVGLPELAQDLGFLGRDFAVVSSLALTIFNVGYAFSNFFGGFVTRRLDPKLVVIAMLIVWSVAVVLTGLVNSIIIVIILRALLGVAEGTYWPQQSRLVFAWFKAHQLTRANSIIQYYGQFLSLAVGFVLLAWLNEYIGWRGMFLLVGGLGLVVALPLMLFVLKRTPQQPVAAATGAAPVAQAPKVTLAAFGGPRFLLLVAAYLTNGMMFWGLTLWLPLAVKDLGATGVAQGAITAIPYLAAVILAIPMTYLSDRTGKRSGIAAFGLLVGGLLLVPLSLVVDPVARMVLITLAMGFYAASFTPNIWSIIQSSVRRDVVGAASGVVNGIGAGLGGVAAGWIVGLLKAATGSYFTGFVVLGLLAVVGAGCLAIHGRLTQRSGGAEFVEEAA